MSREASTPRPVAVALDLGTSRIKAGLISAEGALIRIQSERAPNHHVEGLACTADPEAYLTAAASALTALDAPHGLPLGVSAQRSSFLLWSPEGIPLTPLISWRDLRAREWIKSRKRAERRTWRQTGLPLSPHYAGPKLGWLFAGQPELRARAEAGEALFGTLDSWLIHRWSRQRLRKISRAMAARTLLFDLAAANWSPGLLRFFGVPRACLPDLVSERGLAVVTHFGCRLAAAAPDQTAAAMPVFEARPKAAFLNLGTGTFVLRMAPRRAPRGILTALAESDGANARYFWEAPINAGAALFSPRQSLPDFGGFDPMPDLFAIPDQGLAAPFWRADLARVFSRPERRLSEAERWRALLEGYLFRIRQALECLFPDRPPEMVVASGGLTARADLMATLADFLPYPLAVAREQQLSLLGAGRLAMASPPLPNLKWAALPNEMKRHRLQDKYAAWQAWLAELTAD